MSVDNERGIGGFLGEFCEALFRVLTLVMLVILLLYSLPDPRLEPGCTCCPIHAEAEATE